MAAQAVRKITDADLIRNRLATAAGLKKAGEIRADWFDNVEGQLNSLKNAARVAGLLVEQTLESPLGERGAYQEFLISDDRVEAILHCVFDVLNRSIALVDGYYSAHNAACDAERGKVK